MKLNLILAVAVGHLLVRNVELEMRLTPPTPPAAGAIDLEPYQRDPLFPLPPGLPTAKAAPFRFHLNLDADLKLSPDKS